MKMKVSETAQQGFRTKVLGAVVSHLEKVMVGGVPKGLCCAWGGIMHVMVHAVKPVWEMMERFVGCRQQRLTKGVASMASGSKANGGRETHVDCVDEGTKPPKNEIAVCRRSARDAGLLGRVEAVWHSCDHCGPWCYQVKY